MVLLLYTSWTRNGGKGWYILGLGFVMKAVCPHNMRTVQGCTSDRVCLDILATALDFTSTKY